MNKTLTITTIALVAVVMGISAVTPAIPLANAEHPCPTDPDGDQFDHACGPEQRPSCEDIAAKMEANGVPSHVIEKFLERCVD